MNKYVFWAEWYQIEADMTRVFYLYFFPEDQSVELYDHKTKKVFLRRTRVTGITETDFYIGAKLNIFGRQIDITDYGDSMTKNRLAAKRQNTFALIKPEGINRIGSLIETLLSNNLFHINQCRMVKLSPDESKKFYENSTTGDSILPTLIDNLSAGPVLGMELIGDNVVESIKSIIESDKTIKNIIHCSENIENSIRELNYFFGTKSFLTTEKLDRCTLAIIKPHAVKEGKTGAIISAITESNFSITAIKMVHMERTNCEEFYEVYKNVIPEYVQNVLQLFNGPCIALEIVSNNLEINTHSAFRKLCGPVDPEIGRQLQPYSIRARFGITKVLNAIHCTDLEEDCLLEVEYFFKILE